MTGLNSINLKPRGSVRATRFTVSLFALFVVLGGSLPDNVFGDIYSAVLPADQTVRVGDTATVFATVLNAGPGIATDCSISPVTSVPATFFYQTTDPATNALTGTPNTPVDIAEGAAQTFLFAFTPTAQFTKREIHLSFDCTNTSPAHITSGLNTLLLSSFSGILSAVLPASRSVQVGDTATVFAAVINTGPGIATGCSISPVTSVPATFFYQTTDPTTNALTGTPNTPVDIAEGVAQFFLFAFSPTTPFAPTEVQLNFDCSNTSPAPTFSGLNTLLLSASSTPVPDIIALSTGFYGIPGILNLPASNDGVGAFAVATVNVGSTGTITASADTGSAVLPVSIRVCETNPSTGVCINPTSPAATATTTIANGETPTFAFFATATGPIPLDLASNRAIVRFTDGGGILRGSTSTGLSSDFVCVIGTYTETGSSVMTGCFDPADNGTISFDAVGARKVRSLGVGGEEQPLP